MFLRRINCLSNRSLSIVKSHEHNDMRVTRVATELLHKRKESKDRNKDNILNRADIQVIKSNSHPYQPSILVNSEGRAYMFNCGEGIQRICHSNKIKLSNLEHLFITNLHWANVSGAYGLSLTPQDMGLPSFTIHATEGIKDFFKSVNPFMKYVTGITCSVNICNELEYKDPSIRIRPIILDKNFSTCSDNLASSLKRSRTISRLIAYHCILPDLPGALDPQKCREHNVPIGPKLAILKSGCDITLDDSTIVRSSDVCGPKNRGKQFLIVDCPKQEHLELVILNQTITNLKESNQSDSLDFVIHCGPKDVINDNSYIEWMASFPSDCRHLLCAEDIMEPDIIESHRLQYMLQRIDDNIFPSLYLDETIKQIVSSEMDTRKRNDHKDDIALTEESDLNYVQKLDWAHCGSKITLSHLDRFVVRPKCLIEGVERKYLIDAIFNVTKKHPEFSALTEQYKESTKSEPIPNNHEPEVIFLGTGSAIPSKLRNTSCIIVNIPLPKAASILMDCGEDSYGQLLRFYGPVRLAEFFDRLKLIYISHHHADHHCGLIEILRNRKEAGIMRPVLLLIPPGIESMLTYHNDNFEDLSNTYELIGTRNLKTTQSDGFKSTLIADEIRVKSSNLINDVRTIGVEHCAHACAVVFELNIGHPRGNCFKLAYSGDTRPSKEFISIGRNCDLLIHEATFNHRELDSAIEKKHSTTTEAIEVAKKMSANFTILTHFSQRYAKIPYFTEKFDDTISYAFDNLALRCPSDLKRLPKMKTVLTNVFGKALEDADTKYMRLLHRKALISQLNKRDAC